MTSRKKVHWVLSTDYKLEDELELAIDSDNKRKAAQKDAHLLEAALATDRTIISRDDSARDIFKSVSGSIREIKNIVWVNPTNSEEESVDWLKSGAKADQHRRLGYGLGE